MKKSAAKKLLAVDIGNSTIGFGLFLDMTDPDSLLIRKMALKTALTAAAIKKVIAEMLQAVSVPASPSKAPGLKIGAIVSSVVPSVNSRVIRALEDYTRKPMLLDYRVSGLTFKTPSPESIGSDRLANAVAAYAMSGQPSVVIDFGTATAISAVGGNRVFLGGAILPGIDIMLNSLASKTSKLPALDAEWPETALGRDTASAIKSGVVIGSAGAVIHIIESIEEETGLRLKLVVTGGRAELVSPFLEHAHTFAPNLVFEGMRLVYRAAKSPG
jgi:type III pantothenate kinase